MASVTVITITIITGGVYRRVLLHLQTRAGQDAQDILQEACLRFYEHAPKITDEGELAAWLLTVAYRVQVDQHRHAPAFPCVSLSEGFLGGYCPQPLGGYCPQPLGGYCPQPLGGYDMSGNTIFRIAVAQAMQALNTEQRSLLTMRADGLTCGEMAAKLNLPEETVKKRWQRTRLHCRQTFRGLLTE